MSNTTSWEVQVGGPPRERRWGRRTPGGPEPHVRFVACELPWVCPGGGVQLAGGLKPGEVTIRDTGLVLRDRKVIVTVVGLVASREQAAFRKEL